MKNLRIAALSVLALLGIASSARAQWSGHEVTEDGALVVANPESAMETTTLQLKELWRVGGVDDEETLFGVISQLVRDEKEDLFLLDSQLSEIQVYSAEGTHLRTIGREGEGPGEFRNASDMYLGPNNTLGIVQIFPGKVIQLFPDGSPAGTFRLPEVKGGGFQLVFRARGTKDHVVLAGGVTRTLEGKQFLESYLKSYDPEGNELAHYHTETRESQFGGMKFIEKTFSGFAQRWALAADGRVAAALDFDDYRIHIWNADGSLDRIIDRPEYKLVVRNATEKKRFQALFDAITSWNPGSTFKVSDTHSTVGQIVFREDGSLWVLSSKGTYQRPDGILASFDVYDQQGRYMRQVNIKGEGDPVEDGMFFVGSRLYVVTDLFSAVMASLGGDDDDSEDAVEEPEPIALIAYQLDPVAIGSK